MEMFEKRYRLDFSSVYESSNRQVRELSRHLGAQPSEELCSVLRSDLALELHRACGESAAEFVRHLLNSSCLPAGFPETDRTVVHAGSCERRSADHASHKSEDVCLQARRETPGVLGIQVMSAAVGRLVQCGTAALDEVWREARGRKIALRCQVALWKEKTATMLRDVDWLETFGTSFSAGVLVEMLHVVFESAIACVRRILRALRAGAHALSEVLRAVVSWDPAACPSEQVANVLKKIAAAGLTAGGALLEPLLEAGVISVAPWAAAAANWISAVLTAGAVVIALYILGKLIDYVLGVEEARTRHRVSQTLKTLGGRELLDLLVRIEAPAAQGSTPSS